MTSAVLRFPGGRLASFVCSFGAADVAAYEVVGTRGTVKLEAAYEYVGEKELAITVDGKKSVRRYTMRDQFAPELLHFSDSILSGRDPQPGGREGLADVRVVEALYASAKSGRPVRLRAFPRPPRPTLAKEVTRPPVRKRKLVRAESAGKD